MTVSVTRPAGPGIEMAAAVGESPDSAVRVAPQWPTCVIHVTIKCEDFGFPVSNLVTGADPVSVSPGVVEVNVALDDIHLPRARTNENTTSTGWVLPQPLLLPCGQHRAPEEATTWDW